MHLVSPLDDSVLSAPPEAESSILPGLATDAKPNIHLPHIAPAITRPGCPVDEQRSVVIKLRGLIKCADTFKG